MTNAFMKKSLDLRCPPPQNTETPGLFKLAVVSSQARATRPLLSPTGGYILLALG